MTSAFYIYVVHVCVNIEIYSKWWEFLELPIESRQHNEYNIIWMDPIAFVGQKSWDFQIRIEIVQK